MWTICHANYYTTYQIITCVEETDESGVSLKTKQHFIYLTLLNIPQYFNIIIFKIEIGKKKTACLILTNYETIKTHHFEYRLIKNYFYWHCNTFLKR